MNIEQAWPVVPQAVVDILPALLRDGAMMFTSIHERDVFLTASIGVLSGALPNVVGEHGDGSVPLNLNVCIQAPAGSGKGAMKYSRRLGDVIDKRLHDESVLAIAGDSGGIKGTMDATTVPSIRTLYLGGNSSERALLESVLANNGQGVLFETEILTLSKVLGTVGGDATDLLLKTFHQEQVTVSRKGFRLQIPRPSFSVVVSGTPESLRTIVNRIEVGLFSRFAFYSFDASPAWKSHRPGRQTSDRDLFFERAGEAIDALHQKLERRVEPLVVRLKAKQWSHLDNVFETELHRLHDTRMNPALEASVKRSAVIAFRITCIIAVLRAFENGRRIQSIETLTATDADTRIGVDLALLYLQHAYQVAARLQQQAYQPKDQRRASFLSALPGEFTTGVAVLIGETAQPPIPRRTVMSWIDVMTNQGRIEKMRHGVYRKRDGPL